MSKLGTLIKVISILSIVWTIVKYPARATEPIKQPTKDGFILRSVLVNNSTVFSSEDWEDIIAPYLGQRVDYLTLIEIERQLSELYQRAGYITSGVVLPEQEIENGTVIYEAIEGKLVEIKIEGLSHLQNSYIRSRIEEVTQPPLSLAKLKDSMVLLQQNPLINSLDADFEPGIVQGESTLLMRVKEAPRWSFGIKVDNWENPEIGEVGVGVYGSNLNLLGLGDKVDFEYKFTENEGLDRLSISYSIPVTVNDTTINLFYRNDDTRIVEDIFRDIGVVTQSSTVSIGVTQPIIKKINEDLKFNLSFDSRESETFIFETIPFPIFGDSNEINLSVLRFSLIYLNRTPQSSFAIDTQLSFGLNMFNASPSLDLIDTNFFSVRLQAQYALKIDDNWIALTRFQGQLTPNSLPAMEQIAIAGVESVRGYRRNIRSGDRGFIVNIELPYTVVQSEDGGNISLAPFLDWGGTWNNDLPTIYPNNLVAIGVEFKWFLAPSFSLEANYGVPLVEGLSFSRETLNDSGFHIQLKFGTKF